MSIQSETSDTGRAARTEDFGLQVLMSSPDAVVIIDDSQNICDFSIGAEAAFGYEAGEVLGQPLTMLLPERFRGRHAHHVSAFADAEDGHRFMQDRAEILARRKDGTEFPAEASIFASGDGQSRRMVAMVRDLTDRRAAEHALRERDARLTLLFEDSHDAVIVSDKISGPIIDCNKACLKLLRRSREELIGSYFRDLIEPDNLARRPSEIGRLEAGYVVTVERELMLPEGGTISAIVEARLQGDVSMMVLREVGGDSVAERRAFDADARFGRLFDRSPIPLVVTVPAKRDEQGSRLSPDRIREANEAYLTWTGFSHEEVLGRSIGLALDRETEDRLSQLMADYGRVAAEEITMIAKDRSRFTALAFGEGIELDGEPCTLWSMVDITHQKQLETQLRQSQRLETVGQLAGGIAHDFNNLLAAIMGNAGYLLISMDEDDSLRQVVVDMEQACRQGAGLISQLLAFSKGQELVPEAVDAEQAIERFQRLVDPGLGKNIRLNRIIHTDHLWMVYIDRSQLDQLMMNLVINARDAMPDGGLIEVGLNNLTLNPSDAAALESQPGDYVVLTVKDNGAGMDASVQAQLFDPFFTTKPIGKGTGLGLATVHGIVKQSGGHITVKSELGEGSSFSVYLPRA